MRRFSQQIVRQCCCRRRYYSNTRSLTSEFRDQSDHLKMLSLAKPEDLDAMMGPGRVRSTAIEATIRMMADHFMMYDAMDKMLLDKEMKLSFGDDSKGEELELLQMTDKTLLDEIKDRFYDKCMIEATNYEDYKDVVSVGGKESPQYTRAISNTARNEFNRNLSEVQPGKLSEISEYLMKMTDMPDLRTFHIIIARLGTMRYTQPAQTAMDCLMLSDIQLNAQTLSLAIKLAVWQGDMSRFAKLTRALPELQSVSSKVDPEMSDVALGKWYTEKQIDHYLHDRFFRGVKRDEVNAQYPNIFTGLIEGAAKFGWNDQVDRMISAMFKYNVDWNSRIFKINFEVSQRTNDKKRLTWTWNKLDKWDQFEKIDANDKMWKAAHRAANHLGEDRIINMLKQQNRSL